MKSDIASLNTVRYSSFIGVYIFLVAFASVAVPIGSIYIKIDWIGAAVVCAIGVLRLWKNSRISTVAWAYVVMFTGWLVINGMIAGLTTNADFNFEGYWSYFIQFLVACFTFLVISSLRLATEITRQLLKIWVLIAVAASLLSIVQVVVGDIIVDAFLFIPYYEEMAISTKVISGMLAPTAWFSEASWFSAFLVVPILFVLFELINVETSTRARIVYWLAALLIASGLFMAYSLTAIIAVFVGVVVGLALVGRLRLQILILAVIGLSVYLAYSDSDRVALQFIRFTELFRNLADYSAGSQEYGRMTSFYVRSVGFTEGLRIFWEHPIFGIGIGQSVSPYHSGFITLLAEQGFIGASIYYLAPAWIILKLAKVRKDGSYARMHLATFFIVALVADYVNGLVTHHPFYLQRWLLISIAFGWFYALRQQRRKIVENRFVQDEVIQH